MLQIIAVYSNKPLIAGGLIETKEEVMQALSSGATCVSTTKKEIWEDRFNRSLSLKKQFPKKELLENGKHRFYIKDNILIDRKGDN